MSHFLLGAALPDKQFFMNWIDKSPYPNPTELTLELKGIISRGELNPKGTKLSISNYHEYPLLQLLYYCVCAVFF